MSHCPGRSAHCPRRRTRLKDSGGEGREVCPQLLAGHVLVADAEVGAGGGQQCVSGEGAVGETGNPFQYGLQRAVPPFVVFGLVRAAAAGLLQSDHPQPRLLEPADGAPGLHERLHGEQPMGTPGTTLVIGATGTTGSRVVSRLVVAGHPVKAAGRQVTDVGGAPAVRFNWNDPANPAAGPRSRAAPRGAAQRVGDPLRRSSRRAGPPGPSRPVRRAGAVLRPSWFMQNLTGDHPHAQSIRKDGTLLTATGEGHVGFVDSDDIPRSPCTP
jgi:hypothetical protein